MKSDKKEDLKVKCVELYLAGKTMQDISDIVGCSRNFVGQLIKDDERIKKYKNGTRLKVYKYKNQKKMNVPISVYFLEKIGISNDCSVIDFVDVEVDENKKIITIKKSEN